jgi:uncharacterized integral membrane protein
MVECSGANGAASMMMSEHQKHTMFLRQCILYDESAGRQELDEGIIQIQRNACCVQRAAWLMVILIALAVAGFGYGEVLVENFPYNSQQPIIDIICALGVGSLISLLAFVGLGMVYRRKLDQRREECRELVARLLESRLGKPVSAPWRDNRAGEANGRTARRVASEVNGSPVKIKSAAQG